MPHAFRYAVDEALASLRGGLRNASMAVVTIAVAFLVLGAFLVLARNAETLLSRWREAAELSVYLRDDLRSEQRAAVETAVRESGVIAAVESVSKDEALRRFRESFSAMADVARDLHSNPLPASIEVRLLPDAEAARVEALAQQLSAMAGVADVRYDRQWIQRLSHIIGVVQAGGLVLSVLLMGAAALTVASVVKLALSARRDEIHIMQLVGAPMACVRGPFVMEGLIQGGVGAALALVVLWVSYFVTSGRIESGLGNVIEPDALAFLSLQTSAALLIGGMAVGSLGGVIAARSTREMTD